MNSVELLQIISRWERSKSAQAVLVAHAVNLVNHLVRKEMDAVVDRLCCTEEDLTEENLDLTTEGEMASKLKPAAPTLEKFEVYTANGSAGEEKQIRLEKGANITTRIGSTSSSRST